MSIRQTIMERVQEGRLFALTPLARFSKKIRNMYIAEELKRAFDNPPVAGVEMFARLEADLALFVDSTTIDHKYLKLLAPVTDSVWEIKSERQAPSIRVFGLFADRDVFIAMNYALRSDLDDKAKHWRDAKETAKSKWRSFFPGYDPRKETDALQLVTGALNGKYFRERPRKR